MSSSKMSYQLKIGKNIKNKVEFCTRKPITFIMVTIKV